MEWRTIDSAPKDGRAFLSFEGDDDAYAICRWYASSKYYGWWEEANVEARELGPTHWMPLPAPPGADPGIPVYASRDATDDVLEKEGE